MMKGGELVGAAFSEKVFTNPRHPYTWRLLVPVMGDGMVTGEDPDILS
ncbi:hypothetical protein ACFQ36_04160 [Arthrobacter sp. GCM10027362]